MNRTPTPAAIAAAKKEIENRFARLPLGTHVQALLDTQTQALREALEQFESDSGEKCPYDEARKALKQ